MGDIRYTYKILSDKPKGRTTWWTKM